VVPANDGFTTSTLCTVSSLLCSCLLQLQHASISIVVDTKVSLKFMSLG
jgi:hypothetical protein